MNIQRTKPIYLNQIRKYIPISYVALRESTNSSKPPIWSKMSQNVSKTSGFEVMFEWTFNSSRLVLSELDLFSCSISE